MSDNSFNYLSIEHEHKDGSIGRDHFVTDRMATMQNDTAQEYGLPKAQDIGEKRHLTKGEDY